jgi:hypothetical protein
LELGEYIGSRAWSIGRAAGGVGWAAGLPAPTLDPDDAQAVSPSVTSSLDASPQSGMWHCPITQPPHSGKVEALTDLVPRGGGIEQDLGGLQVGEEASSTGWGGVADGSAVRAGVPRWLGEQEWMLLFGD